MSTFFVYASREDIDIPDLSNANKFAENFNLTMDVTVDKNHCSDITYAWDSGPNEKATRQLLFTTSEEYLQCQEDFGMFVVLRIFYLVSSMSDKDFAFYKQNICMHFVMIMFFFLVSFRR